MGFAFLPKGFPLDYSSAVYKRSVTIPNLHGKPRKKESTEVNYFFLVFSQLTVYEILVP